MKSLYPIGIFDSGVGGLSVLSEIRKLISIPLMYFADQYNVPYGARSMEEIQVYSSEITKYLISRGARIIVIACNTASAAALHYLRDNFPSIGFVGMEPAIKPAAQNTKSGVVGVLATPATFQGLMYASVVERFGSGVTILQSTCPGLVQKIEMGELDSFGTREILNGSLLPMLMKGMDTVVLGCTHYPFVIPLIREIVGRNVRIIDPAPAVARQVVRLLNTMDIPLLNINNCLDIYFTSGSKIDFEKSLASLIKVKTSVIKVNWVNGKIQ